MACYMAGYLYWPGCLGHFLLGIGHVIQHVHVDSFAWHAWPNLEFLETLV